jgi:hypothetical protein
LADEITSIFGGPEVGEPFAGQLNILLMMVTLIQIKRMPQQRR